jgi:peptide/nickel transport system substrate-binding protein
MNRTRIYRWTAGWMLLAVSACSIQPAEKLKIVHYGLTLAPTGIDPQVNASSELGIPLASVYDTLVFRTDTGMFVPGLAESWTVSADATQYIFTLRKDVHFHDGTPFNAAAVKANLERVLNPNTKSQKARGMLGPLQSVHANDQYIVELDLSAPFAPLLDSLSQVYLGIASPDALSQWGADYQFHQVGTGPFRFIEYVSGGHLTLERNPDYAWGPSVYQNQSAGVDRIEFRFYTDPATRAPALLSGEADVMGEVLPHDADSLKTTGRFSVLPVSIPGQPLQFFFQSLRPPTDDLETREALTLAIDRKTIVHTVFGDYSPVATGPLTAVTWGAQPVLPEDAYDAGQARAILERRGWVDVNGDGIREKDGQPLRLKVIVPAWGLAPQVAAMLEQEWKQVGVAAEMVQVSSYSDLLKVQSEGTYHLISFTAAGTDPDLLRPYFRSDGALNGSYVRNDTIDRLLNDATLSLDSGRRLDDYRQVQAEIGQEYLVLPIRDYTNVNVFSTHIHGLHYSAQGWFPVLIDVSWAD